MEVLVPVLVGFDLGIETIQVALAALVLPFSASSHLSSVRTGLGWLALSASIGWCVVRLAEL